MYHDGEVEHALEALVEARGCQAVGDLGDQMVAKLISLVSGKLKSGAYIARSHFFLVWVPADSCLHRPILFSSCCPYMHATCRHASDARTRAQRMRSHIPHPYEQARKQTGARSPFVKLTSTQFRWLCIAGFRKHTTTHSRARPSCLNKGRPYKARGAYVEVAPHRAL